MRGVLRCGLSSVHSDGGWKIAMEWIEVDHVLAEHKHVIYLSWFADQGTTLRTRVGGNNCRRPHFGLMKSSNATIESRSTISSDTLQSSYQSYSYLSCHWVAAILLLVRTVRLPWYCQTLTDAIYQSSDR